MKKVLFFSLIFIALTTSIFAVQHTISINGFAYSPALLTMNVGDTVTIDASSLHPLAQVSSATWYANDFTPLSGGFGVKTSKFTFEPSIADTIFYVCQNHVLSNGMKGKIAVMPKTGVEELVIKADDILLTPNPINSKGILSISINEPLNLTIRLFDYYGRFVKDIATDNIIIGDIKYDIDASELENGIYFILITEGQHEYYLKMAVVK